MTLEPVERSAPKYTFVMIVVLFITSGLASYWFYQTQEKRFSFLLTWFQVLGGMLSIYVIAGLAMCGSYASLIFCASTRRPLIDVVIKNLKYPNVAWEGTLDRSSSVLRQESVVDIGLVVRRSRRLFWSR